MKFGKTTFCEELLADHIYPWDLITAVVRSAPSFYSATLTLQHDDTKEEVILRLIEDDDHLPEDVSPNGYNFSFEEAPGGTGSGDWVTYSRFLSGFFWLLGVPELEPQFPGNLIFEAEDLEELINLVETLVAYIGLASGERWSLIEATLYH